MRTESKILADFERGKITAKQARKLIAKIAIRRAQTTVVKFPRKFRTEKIEKQCDRNALIIKIY